jgi:prefoldin subunit 5
MIHKSFNGVDTDSECSIDSDDILPSTYPVKPRKWSLRPHHSRGGKNSGRGGTATTAMDGKAVDEAFAYMASVAAKNPSLIKAEEQRDYLEQQCESVRESIDSYRAKLNSRRTAHVNYLKLLQLAAASRMKQAALHRKVNSLTIDVVNGIRHCHEATSRIESSVKALEEQRKADNNASKVAKKAAAKRGKPKISGSTEHDSSVTTVPLAPVVSSDYSCLAATAIVHAKEINGKPPIKINITLGAQISTPYGHGIVEGIDCKASMIKIRLSFGIMYSTVNGVLTQAAHSRTYHKLSSARVADDRSLEELSLDEAEPANVLNMWRSLKEYLLTRSVEYQRQSQMLSNVSSAFGRDFIAESLQVDDPEQFFADMHPNLIPNHVPANSVVPNNWQEACANNSMNIFRFIKSLCTSQHELRQLEPDDYLLAFAPIGTLPLTSPFVIQLISPVLCIEQIMHKEYSKGLPNGFSDSSKIGIISSSAVDMKSGGAHVEPNPIVK